MLLFIVFVIILFRSCSSTMEVMDKATAQNSVKTIVDQKQEKINSIKDQEFDCKIDAWKFEKTSSQYITIDGTTSCNRGKLVLKVYDGDSSQYIGNDTTYINNGIFKSLIRTSLNPNKIKVNFTIIKR